MLPRTSNLRILCLNSSEQELPPIGKHSLPHRQDTNLCCRTADPLSLLPVFQNLSQAEHTHGDSPHCQTLGPRNQQALQKAVVEISLLGPLNV